MNKILTVKEIAQQLGINRERAIYYLKGIEQSKNVKILFDRSVGKLRPSYYSTEEILRTYLPELFEEDVFTKETIQNLLKRIDVLEKKVNTMSVKLMEAQNGK